MVSEEAVEGLHSGRGLQVSEHVEVWKYLQTLEVFGTKAQYQNVKHFINSVTDDKIQFNILFRGMRTNQNGHYIQMKKNSPTKIIISLEVAVLDCLSKTTT